MNKYNTKQLFLSSRPKLYEELGCESLSDRRWCRRVLHVHKIVNNETPSYLKDKLPRHRRALYRHINNNSFYKIRCKSDRYMNSFFPDVINTWNIVIAHFPIIPSLGVFKTHILSLIRPVKKSIFHIHNPLGLHYLFQLRIGLSPLRNHKKRHGFVDTPSGDCACNQGIEDTRHFLFSCPLFIPQRATLMASVSVILQNYNLGNLATNSHLYLYGYRTIDFADNRQILLSTIKYITETRRFSE